MPKRNGFSVFMEDRRASVLETGAVLTRGRADLANLLSDEWRDLPQDEKEKFNKTAERFNKQQARHTQVAPVDGKDSGHVLPKSQDPVDPLNSNIPKTLLEQQADNHNVLFELFENYAWVTQPIVVCSFTTYFEHDYGQIYFPAEIGLSTFSVQDGVIDNFARIIDPGDPPMGYGVDVTNRIEILGLPRPGQGSEFSKFESLMLTLQHYLGKYHGSFRTKEFCVFALDCEFEQVAGCFEWLNKNTGYNCPVRVLSLSLFAYLAATNGQRILESRKPLSENAQCRSFFTTISGYRTVGKPLDESFCYPAAYPLTSYGMFVNAKEADEIIRNSDNYKYYDELCCVYHFKKGEGITFCALNMSNRYAFNVLEVLTLSNEVEIIPGQHFPQIDERKTEIQRRHDWLTKWGITGLEMEMKDPPELVTKITQVRPLRRLRSRDDDDETNDRMEDSERIDSNDRNPDENQAVEEGRQNIWTSELRTRRDSRCSRVSDNDLETTSRSGRYRAPGQRNPYQGTTPRVYQLRADNSTETEGADTDSGN